MQPANRTMPAGVRRAMEDHFGCDFSEVRLSIGRRPEDVGAEAFAAGNEVFCLPETWKSNRREVVLAHELAHVVQQREGRIRGARRASGWLVANDPELEWEAVSAALAYADRRRRAKPLAWGRRASARGARSLQRGVVAVQRLVKVAGAARLQLSDFSSGFLKTLDLVPGGKEWLTNALESPDASAIQVPNEGDLANLIQSGLHSTSLIFIEPVRLPIGPAKLVSLPEEVVTTITSGNTQTAALYRLLSKLGLHTQEDLAAGANWVKELGLNSPLCLQVQTLRDQINLVQLSESAGTAGNDVLAKEAAGFAVDRAQNTDEFIQSYAFYRSITEPLQSSAASARKKKAAAVWEHLFGLSLGLTRAPNLGLGYDPETVLPVLQKWCAEGGQPGFANVAAAVSNIARHAALPNDATRASETEVGGYVSQACDFFAALDVHPAAAQNELGQDGLHRSIKVSSENGAAEIQVNPFGIVTLTSFVPAKQLEAKAAASF